MVLVCLAGFKSVSAYPMRGLFSLLRPHYAALDVRTRCPRPARRPISTNSLDRSAFKSHKHRGRLSSTPPYLKCSGADLTSAPHILAPEHSRSKL